MCKNISHYRGSSFKLFSSVPTVGPENGIVNQKFKVFYRKRVAHESNQRFQVQETYLVTRKP